MQANTRAERLNLDYFEGTNSAVTSALSKKYEFRHTENVRSIVIGSFEKREGQTPVGNTLAIDRDYGLKYFPNSGANKGLYRMADTAGLGACTIHYLSNADVWTPLAGMGANMTNGDFDYAVAEEDLYLVNYNDNNRYISGADGETVIDSTYSDGQLYNSPRASKIAYYKSSLYLADYTYGGVRYPTSILKSSRPLGIVALISGDPSAPYTSINVTDAKYIYTAAPGNTLDVYRGASKIAVITVTAISINTITCTTAFEPGFTALESADELWAPNTFNGKKQFRWVTNGSESGEPVKEYNTLRLSGGDGSPITMLETISNVLMIANKTSIASWNDYTFQSFDHQIGCVSKRGYVKKLGALYFLDYNGVFVTAGEAPKLISTKVERYIKGATKAGKEACAAGKKGNSIFFSIGDVTLYNDDGSQQKVLNNVVLEYNIVQQDWYVHTNVPATAFETFVDDLDTDRLVMTTTTNDQKIMEFLSGETDDGAEIAMVAETPDFYLNKTLERYVHPNEAIFEVLRGANVEVFVSLDGGTYYKIDGTGEKGANILKITAPGDFSEQPVRCRMISLSFRHALPQLAKISRAAITFVPTNEEDAEWSATGVRY